MTGTIHTIHLDDRLGSYGLIEAENGERYVFNAGVVMRDGTRIEVGRRVTFEPVDWHYAQRVQQDSLFPVL